VYYLSTQNIEVIITFTLYAISLLVILVVYFERDTQNMVGGQVHWKVRDILLLTLEIGDSFS